MHKLTLAVALCAAVMLALAPVASVAKNLTEITTYSQATTNTVALSDTPTGAFDGEYVKYDTVCVSCPPLQTGQVTIAALRAGTYQTLATMNFTNLTSSAAVTTLDMADVPVNGRLRFTFRQFGASTNEWSAISFFDGLN